VVIRCDVSTPGGHANNVGDNGPLLFDPVNGWTATLIVAVALDLGASRPGADA